VIIVCQATQTEGQQKKRLLKKIIYTMMPKAPLLYTIMFRENGAREKERAGEKNPHVAKNYVTNFLRKN
jgi:hypothetical protein